VPKSLSERDLRRAGGGAAGRAARICEVAVAIEKMCGFLCGCLRPGPVRPISMA
jgi:hypothetical protein